MRRRALHLLLAATAACLAVATPLAATTIAPPANLGRLAQMSHSVVLARAADTRVEDRGLPVSVTTFEQVSMVGGRELPAVFEVEVPGGRIDEHHAAIVEGAPRFTDGHTYLMFLARAPRDRWRPQMLAYGLFEEVDGKLLTPVPEAHALEILGKRFEPPATYDERALVARLRAVLAGAPWDATRAGLVRGEEAAAAAAATLVGKAVAGAPAACVFQTDPNDNLPLRKFGYETGAAMSIAPTTPGQSGISDGGVSAVQQGTAAWTNHPDSVINFSAAATRPRAISCTASSDVDQGGVVFNDPCNDITDLVGCAGTLAFGGSFYDPSTSKPHDGVQWHDVTVPFVVVNNGSECVGETKFKTMVTHELGHTQGFGHHNDPNATMAAVLPNDNRGAALATTDQECASFSYHTFLDVPYRYFAWQFIEAVDDAGVDHGCGSGNFCPGSAMTREVMAVWLLKAKEGASYVPPACTTATFSDVPCSSAYAPWIYELVRRGVTAGCSPGLYCPTDSVTRSQMAVFLLATLQGPGWSPPACTVPRFHDVPCSSPFAPWVDEIAARGITAGCGGGDYCPNGVVTRDQMAVFVTTNFRLPTPPAPPP
jgi:hypothetical protein